MDPFLLCGHAQLSALLPDPRFVERRHFVHKVLDLVSEWRGTFGPSAVRPPCLYSSYVTPSALSPTLERDRAFAPGWRTFGLPVHNAERPTCANDVFAHRLDRRAREETRRLLSRALFSSSCVTTGGRIVGASPAGVKEWAPPLPRHFHPRNRRARSSWGRLPCPTPRRQPPAEYDDLGPDFCPHLATLLLEGTSAPLLTSMRPTRRATPAGSACSTCCTAKSARSALPLQLAATSTRTCPAPDSLPHFRHSPRPPDHCCLKRLPVRHLYLSRFRLSALARV